MLQSASAVSQELHKLRQENAELREMYQQLRTEFNDFRELILGPDCLLPAHEADTGSVPPEASGSGTRHDPEVPMQDVDNDVDRNEDRAPSPAIKNDVDMNHDRAPSAAIDNDVEMDHDRAPSASITLPEGTEDVAAGMEMDWSAENETGQADERSPSRGAVPASPTQSISSAIPPVIVGEDSHDSPGGLASQQLDPVVNERPPEPAYAPPPLPPCDAMSQAVDVLPGTTPAEQQSPKDAQENVVDTRANEPDDEPGIGPQGRSAEPTGQSQDGEHPESPSVTPNAAGLQGDSDMTAQRTEPADEGDIAMTSGENDPGASNDHGGVATPPMVPSWTTLQGYADE
ncbi:uncharacterized protein B0H18DRAFT_962307 [Fomitopsis serialis]|uniref:uncharacterized protein n=1 Tax=Fomitopsis serialis TaxID=139415 RepID=UPI002008805F|nr:uncharacterized protein B0H18DRAFT_962307 [Neoantrodia serialis]KAH9911346.1 hypothetical protein B0H18DRAFT_962307 [Neoantrodia serialis]